MAVGKEPVVYGLYNDGHISAIDAGDYTVEPALNDGKFAANTYTIRVGDKTDSVTVTA